MSTTPEIESHYQAPEYVEEGGFFTRFFNSFNGLQPIADLLARVIVAWAFYTSGLTKTLSASFATLSGVELRYPVSLEPTSSAVTLFKYEYNVPFIEPELAAQLGTAAEIVLPVLLFFGLFGRLSALGLFVFNIVAVLSYEAAQTGNALYLHVVWGVLLLYVVAHGPGKISIDHLFRMGSSKS